jgi:hypothetical protein
MSRGRSCSSLALAFREEPALFVVTKMPQGSLILIRGLQLYCKVST